MKLTVFLFILVCCSSCFRRWVMTDKQIREYYKGKAVKPVLFTIQNDSVSLFCAATGSDTLPPLILIHGAPGAWYGSRNMLDDTILQRRFHVIAVDRLGYGKSRFKRKRKPVNSLATQATAIAEALRINRSFKKGIVLGSSYGAPIAAEMAIMYPERFSHLMMLAAAIDPEKEKFWWFHRFLRSGLLVQLLPRYIRTATAEKFGHVAELKQLDTQWPNLHVPTTVVQGGRDYIIEPSNLDYARQVLAGKRASFVFLPEASHLLRWQAADTVRSLLLRAIDSSAYAR